MMAREKMNIANPVSARWREDSQFFQFGSHYANLRAIQDDGRQSGAIMFDSTDPDNTITNFQLRPSGGVLSGDLIVRPGDWIVKGVEGEFYPCTASIFEKTYELVTP